MYPISNERLADDLSVLGAKVDKIAEMLGSLTRIEEKILNQAEGMARLGARIDKQDLRLDVMAEKNNSMEIENARKSVVYTIAERVVWLIITGSIVAYFGFK